MKTLRHAQTQNDATGRDLRDLSIRQHNILPTDKNSKAKASYTYIQPIFR